MLSSLCLLLSILIQHKSVFPSASNALLQTCIEDTNITSRCTGCPGKNIHIDTYTLMIHSPHLNSRYILNRLKPRERNVYGILCVRLFAQRCVLHADCERFNSRNKPQNVFIYRYICIFVCCSGIAWMHSTNISILKGTGINRNNNHSECDRIL